MGNCVPEKKIIEKMDQVDNMNKGERKCEDLSKSGSTCEGNIPAQDEKWLNP
jgi:hypothetical protein